MYVPKVSPWQRSLLATIARVTATSLLGNRLNKRQRTASRYSGNFFNNVSLGYGSPSVGVTGFSIGNISDAEWVVIAASLAGLGLGVAAFAVAPPVGAVLGAIGLGLGAFDLIFWVDEAGAQIP